MASTPKSSSGSGNRGIVITGGEFNAGQVAVGDNARATMRLDRGSSVVVTSRSSGSWLANAAKDPEMAQAALHSLLAELKAALQSTPAGHADEAELLAGQAAQLVKAATRSDPSQTLLHHIGKGLKETASFLKEAVPQAIGITGQLVNLVSKLHGLNI